MDNGTISLFLTPILVIIASLITQWVVRRNAKDNTEIGRFEANLEAYRGRAEAAETRVAALEAKDNEKEKRIEKLEQQYTAQARQITRIRTVVQEWFRNLKAAWPSDIPMPVPSDEDLELLGITVNKLGEE